MAGVLAALVGIVQQAGYWAPLTQRDIECFQRQLRTHVIGDGVADHTMAIQIEHDVAQC